MDPISIAAGTIGAKFLEEAVKFLWNEAGKLLDRYHARKKEGSAAVETLDDPAPPELKLPAKRVIDFDAVAKREENLLDARAVLQRYHDGHRPASADDPRLIENVNELLAILGDIYHQPVSGVVVRGDQTIDVNEAGATATAVDVENAKEGTYDGKQKVITNKGNAAAVKIKF